MPPHVGQPVEWIQLAAMHTVFFHCAVEQKAAPSVRQAVIEYTEQAVEDRRVGNGHAGPERKFDRRNLNARRYKRGIVLEKDMSVLEREASNFSALRFAAWAACVQISRQQLCWTICHGCFLFCPSLSSAAPAWPAGRRAIEWLRWACSPRPACRNRLGN